MALLQRLAAVRRRRLCPPLTRARQPLPHIRHREEEPTYVHRHRTVPDEDAVRTALHSYQLHYTASDRL